MADPNYPDNLFRFDELNSLFGGESKGAFGGKAWSFINGWVRDIAAAFLSHVRVSWSTQAPTTQDAVVVGDCMAVDLTRSAEGGPYIGKLSTIGAANGIFIGIAAEPAGAGARFRLAVAGPIPSKITGLMSLPARSPVSADPVGNRLRVGQPGDVVLGYSDPNGNVLLLPAARVI